MNVMSEYDKLVERDCVILESVLLRLQNAIAYNNDEEKRRALIYGVRSNIVSKFEKELAITKEFSRTGQGFNFTSIDNIYALETDSLDLNIRALITVFDRNLQETRSRHSSFQRATHSFFAPTQTYVPNQVLFEENGQRLQADDLLKVSKYAVSIAEAFQPDNENFVNASVAISLFQATDLLLNNKSHHTPSNELLKLGVDFLSGAVKASLNDSNAKRNVTITATILNLAIDFFSNRR